MYSQSLGVLIGASLILLSSPGCKSGPQAIPAADQPSLSYGRVTAAKQTLADFEANFGMTAHNPGAAAFKLVSASYELSTEDTVLGEGTLPLSVEVPANGQAEFVLPVFVNYARDVEEIKAFSKRESLPLLLEGTLLTADGKKIEFSRAGSVRGPRLPYVKLEEPDAARQRLDAISAVFRIGVYNDNPFELRIDALDIQVFVEGNLILDQKIGVGQRIPPSAHAVIQLPGDLTEETVPGIAKIVKEKNALDLHATGTLHIQGLSLPVEETTKISFTATR